MFNYQHSQNLWDIQSALDENFPSPEEDLIRLCSLAAHSPADYTFATFRFIVLEIDGLVVQLRWHIGQAMALINQVPEIIERGQGTRGQGRSIDTELPIRGHLLLRKEIAQPETLLFADPLARWRGGSVAEWIFQMTIDNTITRSIAVLDRLARLIGLLADVGVQQEKINFCYEHLQTIHQHLHLPETERLLTLAQDPLLTLLFDYRDNWNFERLTHSNIAGFLPVDNYLDEAGQKQKLSAQQVSGDLLLALLNASYVKVAGVLHEVVNICEKVVPTHTNNLAW